jgi:chromosome segregation ATPase
MRIDHRMSLAPALAALVVLGPAAGLAGAQDGIKQTEAVVKKGELTIQSITTARQQLEKTLAAYNAIIDGKTPDTKTSYKDLEKAVKECEARVEDVEKQKAQMDAEAEKLYAGWTSSLAAISSPELKQKSEARLTQTRERMGKVAAAGHDARASYDGVLRSLKDHITYLGHDLNPTAVSSLKGDAAKLNDEAKAMFAKIDGTVATASSSLAALRQR